MARIILKNRISPLFYDHITVHEKNPKVNEKYGSMMIIRMINWAHTFAHT